MLFAMAHTLAFAATPIRILSADRLRMAVVSGCALALILAERALPVF
jgi:hypothetical protein